MERRNGHSEGELGQEKLIYALISVLNHTLNHPLKLICRSLKDRRSILYFSWLFFFSGLSGGEEVVLQQAVKKI